MATLDNLAASDQDNLYSVLNLPRNADLDQIQRHFKLLSRAYHPDKTAASAQLRETANRTFVCIKNAADVLSDPVYRLAYDHGGMLAVGIIKRMQTAAQSHKIRNKDSSEEEEASEDVYTELQQATTQQDAESIIDDLIEGYRVQQDEISIQQLDASGLFPYVFERGSGLHRESASLQFQTRQQVSHTTAVSFGAATELRHTANVNVGVTAGVDVQPVVGTNINATAALNGTTPVVSLRTTRRSAVGTVMTAGIAGSPQSRKSWDVSVSSIRSLLVFLGRTKTNDDDASAAATRLQASWTLAFKPATRALRGLMTSVRTTQYPIWRCRLSLTKYPFKLSWRGAETNTFYAAFSWTISQFRFKLLRISSIGKSWRIKYGLKYDGLALYSGESMWNILCRVESDQLSLQFPVALQGTMSPVSWLVSLLIAEFVEQHVEHFTESRQASQKEVEFDTNKEKEAQSLLPSSSRQFLDVVRQVASKKRTLEASRQDGGLLILKAVWQSGKEQEDLTDILQFWVVHGRLNMPVNDARSLWQERRQTGTAESATSWWQYLIRFGGGTSEQSADENASGLLRVRYRSRGLVYEIVFQADDSIELPSPLATELGLADQVL